VISDFDSESILLNPEFDWFLHETKIKIKSNILSAFFNFRLLQTIGYEQFKHFLLLTLCKVLNMDIKAGYAYVELKGG